MALAHSPRIVTNGLILCLDAANPKSYPGSGTTWTNLINTNYTANFVNEVTYNSGNLGTLSFDGTNDWVNLGTATQLGWSQVNSVSFWFTVGTTANHILTMWDLVGGVNQRTINHNISSGKLVQYWSPDGIADGTAIQSTSTISTNQWYNICSVFRSGVRELWVNGNLEASLSQASIYRNATTSRLGFFNVPARSGDTPTGYSSGRGSNVQLYSTVLTEAEIKQNFNALRGRFGI